MGFTKDIIGTNESVGGINLFEKVQSTQPATPYTAGLMSATDKSKLDSLENYVHPDSGVVPGKYMQVDVNEQGHVVAGRELQNSTLEDYRIKDAYIDLSDNSIVLGSHRIKPITPSDKVRWEQIVDTPNTLKEFGVTDVALSDGTINIGGDLITPLTADSQIAADKIAGVIDLKNIPVGAMERCVVVEDDAARFALTTNDVQKGDTVKVINPTPTMYMVVDESKLDSADGYVVYSAGNANSVPWGGITDKPDQFYTLPKANINTLGGVIIGDNITVDADGKISTHSPYRLPQASDTVLGGVKIGENILEQPDGTINISTATTNAPGVVKIGDNINIDDDGTISTEKYQLPTATNMRLGGVRIGKYLSVDSEGLLNATGVPITASKTDMGGVIIGENIDIDENGKISVTLPTKTSELENDSEFITTENLSLHNNDENAHASKFEAMHGQLVNVYNNVAEMKQSTRLKAGMAAKTLGYYSANDGGGAYYTIREKADGDVDNGGSIHELANGLVAELIVENGTVNVKQFGAKGDGVHDDTQAIQTAIDYARSVFLINKTCAVVGMPAGTYKVTATITVPRYVSIKSLGSVVIHAYTNNSAAIQVTNKQNGDINIANDMREYYGKLNRLRGTWIDGDNGGIHIIGKINTAIGLEIGSSNNPDNVLANVAGGSIKNLGVTKCDIGIKFNVYNDYLNSFYNCHIEENNTNIQFGNGVDGASNSGENISFYFCNISAARIGIKFDIAGFDTNFFGCSFDFNTITFSVLRNFHNINIYGGHIETTKKIIHSEGTGNHLISVYINGTVIICDNAPLYDGKMQLKTDSVILERHSLTSGYKSFMYLATDDVIAEEKSTRLRGGGGNGGDFSFENIYLPLSAKNNKIRNSKFEDISFPTYGSITHTTSGIAIGTVIKVDDVTLTAGTDFNVLPTDAFTAGRIVNALNNNSTFNTKFVASNVENVITVRSKDRTGTNVPTMMTVSGTYGKVVNGQLIPGGLNYVDINVNFFDQYFRACSGYGGIRAENVTCKLTNSFPDGSDYTCVMEGVATGANNYVCISSKKIKCIAGMDLVCGTVIYSESKANVKFYASYYDIDLNPLSVGNFMSSVEHGIAYGRWNTYMSTKYNHHTIPSGADYMVVEVSLSKLNSGQKIYIGDVYVDMQ